MGWSKEQFDLADAWAVKVIEYCENKSNWQVRWSHSEEIGPLSIDDVHQFFRSVQMQGFYVAVAPDNGGNGVLIDIWEYGDLEPQISEDALVWRGFEIQEAQEEAEKRSPEEKL